MPVAVRQAVDLLRRFTRAAHETGGGPASELEPRVVGRAEAHQAAAR